MANTKTADPATKTLHVENVPEDFIRTTKANAAASGCTLREFVLNAIARANQQANVKHTRRAS